jgi:hypothetical protein
MSLAGATATPALTYDHPVLRVARAGMFVAAALVVAAAAEAGLVSLPNRVANFGDLPRGWGPGIPRDVRAVSRIVGRIDGYTIAAAPTRNGNYCEAFWVKGGKGGWAGCHVRGAYADHRGDYRGYLIGAAFGANQTSVRWVSGSTAAGPQPHLYLVYADGSRERLAMIWVTKPIRAGFFYRAIPKEHLTKSRRATSLVLRDHERLIARQQIPLLKRPPLPR